MKSTHKTVLLVSRVLNAAENPLQEGSTFGDRDIFEAFAEANFPLLDSLDFDTALRYTDEENFGSEVTWRARLAWRPLDYLTLSGSAGTSYRAPNLREQFLAGQGRRRRQGAPILATPVQLLNA